ncbi:MAG: DNA mismatch repair protein MutS [Pontiellaceae bacterium]|jgi:DNA mismatch repair protein MutS|nr:DNA mismatch repair protein MutS [Pontiellaceae bacterium]
MSTKSTPMMDQYRRIRRELPDNTILFFRLGDFYEMFMEDAREAARILDITLTKRHDMPMCGVPYHAAEGYLAQLIAAGKKVAICEQVEDPAAAKGIVKREITRVVTPGTILDETSLDRTKNNYLAGLVRDGGRFGLAMLDLSTGAFWIEESCSGNELSANLARYAPQECVVAEAAANDAAMRPILGNTLQTVCEDWIFELASAEEVLLRHFKVHSLKGFGCENSPLGLRAAGAVLYYVNTELRRNLAHVRRVQIKNPDDYLLLDETTVMNLELVAPLNPVRQGPKSTLLSVLDTTRTAMGARMLRDWIVRPLSDLASIEARLDAVQTFTENRTLLAQIREILGEMRDLERIMSRLGSGGGNARDLRAVGESLDRIPNLKSLLAENGKFQTLEKSLTEIPDLGKRINEAIDDEPAVSVKDGGMIRRGFSAELDDLRDAAGKGKQWLAEFQAAEQERTGIKSLKVRFNQVFGYFIEITNSNLAMVPEHYTRKQTMVNAERFITPELKEYENKILGAQERAVALEFELFAQLREEVVKHIDEIQRNARAVAEADVLAAFAENALSRRYVRPVMSNGNELILRDGRHPVVEQMPDAERFVPNDTTLNCTDHQLIVITGPNMAGKSTYIRQVALITIMAHIGSFVPASKAQIGLVDRVFTRVGASDDLARGRSTFMVEMQETANILNNATPKSLIVLDEIGRGTSTFDGISIAWSVAEFLCTNPDVRAKTLFATHYHELTDLSLTLKGVQNANVLVKERGDQITFLRKIVPGAADKSYGIHVARLAGLPAQVLERANEILRNLEEGEFEAEGSPKIARHGTRRKKPSNSQMNLF